MLELLLHAFALFYTSCYVFLAPSVTGEFLPLKLITNHDLYWYITPTRFLQDLGHHDRRLAVFFGHLSLTAIFRGAVVVAAGVPTR